MRDGTDNFEIPAWVGERLVPVDKIEVHARGLRHPAVSVFVMWQGRTLLQQRAAGKYHTPGLWANSCCTHPDWGEAAIDCAERRLAEELGLKGLPLRPAGRIEYRADVGAGLTEHELVEVFVSEPTEEPRPHPAPAEVQDTAWITPEALRADLARRPERYTPWLRIYMEKAGLLG
ncbi:isopentenyl-diphosphate Delta-isomerase [Limimaricola hongkongensis]|uniref:Isopentenyl-diphosphate Delta-isomerase n=1 Tax=Limimaricola hongkongensis DSM 17492 TaxID=1122180 RepID=A0A017HFF2_9RHOB|nr:isopentenyl-diphosphate delta-isomerase [Limimaricola hongkongensis]EYD73061.1 Isopentenyl-diphosphate delta-isomerase [Limimaricola hongkongensis DSM 17492]